MPADHVPGFSTPPRGDAACATSDAHKHHDFAQPQPQSPRQQRPSSPSPTVSVVSSDHPSNRPPLPPRPSANISVIDGKTFQPPARPTTALTSVAIQTLSFPDGSRGTFPTPTSQDIAVVTPLASLGSGSATPSRSSNAGGSAGEGVSGTDAGTGDDAASMASFAATTMRPPGDIASLLAGDLNRKSAAWNLLRTQSAAVQPFENVRLDVPSDLAGFEQEFDPLPPEGSEDSGDDGRLQLWKAKLKHYMILSSAGKPIYSRHGDLALINASMGVVQTIISFYEGASDKLLGFTAGKTRFVVITQGPLYLVAISKLGESDVQLRAQLDALYMQILSTLTLPTLTKIFANRPSSDLRKPLEGTEPLLSSLADNFTRGSASTLLGALECLKLRKSQRHAINNAFLKLRSERLLYGLIVAGGRLVSVIRPRRHSLHPSDLQLIFNMLFESGGVKAGGGENWIPLCLPSFNNRGYLYMYVSFLDSAGDGQTTAPVPAAAESKNNGGAEPFGGGIAMILISTDKESFFELQQMRHAVDRQLATSGLLAIVAAAARTGRPFVQDVAPGSQVSHFLYKSRANVQFYSSSLEPAFSTPLARRRLLTLYHGLHAAIHSKHSPLKVLHSASGGSTSLAWVTPVFELYCVAGPNVSRATITQGATKIAQWAKREEERLFIIGGGVW